MSLQDLYGRLAAIVVVMIALMLSGTPVSAQKVPEPVAQEILIKTTLLTFNDANVTGNYAVLHAKMAKPFRDEFSPERLAAVFKAFRDQKTNFAIIATLPPIASEPPSVEKGILKLFGHFATSPSRVNYFLEFMGSEGEWKASRVEVQIKPMK